MGNSDFVLQQISFDDKPKNLSNIDLPLILKNRSLMPPGTYNGFYIKSSIIKEAFSNTNWNMKELRSLYAGHPQDPLPTEWVGEVQNPHFDEEMGGLRGDIILVDPSAAMKVAFGAKFGISPSIEAITDSHVVNKFSFRNFGLVIQPAMVRNYLNNAQKKEVNMEENQVLEAINSLKTEFVNMKQEMDKIKMGLFELEITDEDILQMAKDEGFADFYKKFKKKYPDATMKDAAKVYKKYAKKEEYPEEKKEVKAEEEKTEDEESEDEKKPEKKKEPKEEESSEEEPANDEGEEKTEKVEGANNPKFSSFLKKLKKKDPKITKTEAKKLFKKKYPKAKVNFEEEKDEEESEKKPEETKAIAERLAALESKADKPIRESETAGGEGHTQEVDVEDIFFRWIKSLDGG